MRDGVAPETKWRQSYDTTLADVFDVQSAVATRVADKLGVVLSAPARCRSPHARHATFRRMTHTCAARRMDGSDPASLRRALAGAEQAVALDSGFAAAWARISACHTYIYFRSIPTRADAEAAQQAAERAIALAPAASDGYIATVRSSMSSYDMAAARTAYETALRLAPSSIGSQPRTGGRRRGCGIVGSGAPAQPPGGGSRSPVIGRSRPVDPHLFCGSGATRKRARRPSVVLRLRQVILGSPRSTR